MKEPIAFYHESDDLVYHLKIKKGDIAPYVLLPGDPKRCAVIATYLEDPILIADYREYVTITGTYKGIPVSVCSTGIGGPSASIAVEELIECGAHTFIRVGTSGALRLDVQSKDLIIAQAAVRDEGTSMQYLPVECPVCANFDIIQALEEVAINFEHPYHVGMIHSKDSFYTEVEPQNSFFRDKEEQKLQWYTKCGVLASEMECAAIFSVGAIRKVRTGAILQVVDTTMLSKYNTPIQKQESSIDTVIKTALEALYLLAKSEY